MAASLNGDTGIGGVTTDVDMSFSDIWDKLNAGFMAAFEARKGPWIFLFDACTFDWRARRQDHGRALLV